MARTPVIGDKLMDGVNQEIRGVALEPGERVLHKAQSSVGRLGSGDLTLTSRRLVWAGALDFLPLSPSWFVPGWRVVLGLRDMKLVCERGSVLVVEVPGSHYEFGLRRWFIPSRSLAKHWAAAVEGARQAAIQGNGSE